MKKDYLQELIASHLSITESLINEIIKKISGKSGDARIIGMEDLCISDNIVRMQGGFFTGTYITWKCNIPFIPVDATVNSCGVSVYMIDYPIKIEDFQKVVEEIYINGSFDNWNFTKGNHFISLCVDDYHNSYILIHASDSKYKFGELGLYPYNKPWYEDKICLIEHEDRYIRYIYGEVAERFYELYKLSEAENPLRNLRLCEKIVGKNHITKILYCPHYGMPSSDSIAIGCQWKKGTKIMLTVPGKDIFIFNGDDNELYPHGFGMIVQNVESINYSKGKIKINDVFLDGEDSFIQKGNLKNRFENEEVNKELIRFFLDGKKIEFVNVLHQIAAFTRFGFSIYQ